MRCGALRCAVLALVIGVICGVFLFGRCFCGGRLRGLSAGVCGALVFGRCFFGGSLRGFGVWAVPFGGRLRGLGVSTVFLLAGVCGAWVFGRCGLGFVMGSMAVLKQCSPVNLRGLRSIQVPA
jgi:hypothetical protein